MQKGVSGSTYKYEDGPVLLADLRPCPYKVTMQTDSLLSEVASTARSHPERIGPLTVAAVGTERYIADGHLRARALAMSGQESASARTVKLGSLKEAVRLHIELNTHGSINPVAMMDAISFVGARESAGLISERYAMLAKGFLHEKPRGIIDSFISEACKKYRTFEMPPYVAARLASIRDEQEQFSATKMVLNGTRNTRGSRFSFPSPTDLDVIILSLKPRNDSEKKVTIFEPEDDGREPPRIDRKEAELLVRGSPHNSILLCTCGKKMLINTRTRRVSRVSDDMGTRFIKLEEEDPARPVIVMPEAVLEFLDAEAESLRYVKVGSRRGLEKLASSLKDGPGLRIVVIMPR